MVHLKMVIPKSEVQGSRVKGLGFRVECFGLGLRTCLRFGQYEQASKWWLVE